DCLCEWDTCLSDGVGRSYDVCAWVRSHDSRPCPRPPASWCPFEFGGSHHSQCNKRDATRVAREGMRETQGCFFGIVEPNFDCDSQVSGDGRPRRMVTGLSKNLRHPG